MISRLGGRKWVGFVVLLITSIGLHTFSKTPISYELVTLLLGLYSAFALGNVSEAIAAIRGTSSKASASPEIEQKVVAAANELAAYTNQRLQQTEQQLSVILEGVKLQNDAIGALLERQAGQAAANRAAVGEWKKGS